MSMGHGYASNGVRAPVHVGFPPLPSMDRFVQGGPFPIGDRTGRRGIVLVADDEPHIVDLLALLLEDEGYIVLRAYDGEQAWDLALQARPDLVISDVMMPRLGGPGLFRRLRGTRGFDRTPVILMSAVPSSATEKGAQFIAKPFDIERVVDLVAAELAAA
ncbi:MAG: hypothetical protein AVDCRST_MAG73-734 [uncultured Thermomicrobiales bacterium]|uniref:Response regulatory domain-containing protein n=1 Tax=uncultured Thermomicrobiales bacterium TaxID=1645740 RepID=A0A6J4TNX9_9BACT|nr:MAG: hypothetical protein AVDCRST_MAG73-734 [uncultured Thermomicrobiales bacterium]